MAAASSRPLTLSAVGPVGLSPAVSPFAGRALPGWFRGPAPKGIGHPLGWGQALTPNPVGGEGANADSWWHRAATGGMHMRFIGKGRTRLVATIAAVLIACGAGVALASSYQHTPSSNARAAGRGINEFGMTHAFFKGHTVRFTYTKGYWCDRHVRSTATSKCEAGAKWKHAPSRHHDPLYITVPLGFTAAPMAMDCPNGLVCVDHPGTIDLRRLEPALKPLYPHLTPRQLRHALANFPTPGHQHFITDKNAGKPEWWDVRIVGVTSRAEYQAINHHKSAHYLLRQVKQKKTTGVIPTNLFLYFGVK
jgi:hypothetical protein